MEPADAGFRFHGRFTRERAMADDDADKLKNVPADGPGKVAEGDVLTNAVRRLDNRFRGVPNDASLIGEDLPDEDEDDLERDEDADPLDEGDDPDRERRNKLW
jgi:hypothetical protein